MPNRGEGDLIEQLELARTLHEQRAAAPQLAAALDRLAEWQAHRLNATYADLARVRARLKQLRFFGPTFTALVILVAAMQTLPAWCPSWCACCQNT